MSEQTDNIPIDAITSKIKEGKIEDAQALVDSLLREHPQHAEGWYFKAVIERVSGNGAGAVTSFNAALKYKPDYKEACCDLADMMEAAGKIDIAVKLYSHWLKIEQARSLNLPTPPVTPALDAAARDWFHTGERYHHRGDAKNAATAFRKVLDIRPDMPEALTNLGIALYHQRLYAEAHGALLRCMHIKFNHIDALNILGTLYRDTGHYAKAIAVYRKVTELAPSYLPAFLNLGNAWQEMQHYEEACEAYKETLRHFPGNMPTLASLAGLLYKFSRWQEAQACAEQMRKIITSGTDFAEPFIVATLFDSPQLQYENAGRFVARKLPSSKPYDMRQPLPAEARADGKLRIGYLSCDLQHHATTRLICELFELHDRRTFEIHAYSYGPDDGTPSRIRVMNAVDKFIDLSMTDDMSAADLIRENGVDILVDLKGYTERQRLGIMASRPAPVQMHYLGFPGTTGTPFIDYFIADSISAPPELEEFFTEKLIRLPHTYQINDRKRALPSNDIPPRTAYGLPEKGFVFCGFNNSYKITRDVFAVWLRILHAVEGSVLWLYESHPESTHELKREAEIAGISPERLVISKKLPQPEHLKRYRHADLFIDTFPVCGHTTTSDALWCGVPAVTMLGKSFISRVAASLLHAVELPELVTHDLAAYEALAIALAHDPVRLKKLHTHLIDGRMRFPLFDSVATTRAIEASYQHAIELHRKKIAPQAFTLREDYSIV